jgi:hypothetical protein
VSTSPVALAIVAAFILPALAGGQQFEQVSVRPARNANRTRPTFHSDAVTLSVVNTSLRMLIQRAYGVEDYQIVAPDWMMLAERFHLAVHKESRILPVYAMSVEKSGIKFREATPGVEHTDPVFGSYSGSKITMAVLAQYLTTAVGTPVTDSTGLTGVYDVTLRFQSIPALPVALSDELGLRLDKRKAPVEVLVVDHVENLPAQ